MPDGAYPLRSSWAVPKAGSPGLPALLLKPAVVHGNDDTARRDVWVDWWLGSAAPPVSGIAPKVYNYSRLRK